MVCKCKKDSKNIREGNPKKKNDANTFPPTKKKKKRKKEK